MFALSKESTSSNPVRINLLNDSLTQWRPKTSQSTFINKDRIRNGGVTDYLSESMLKYENHNLKLDVEYFDWGNGNLHYYYAGTGAFVVTLMCAGAVLFSFTCLAWYSYTDGEVVMVRTNQHPYFNVKNGGDMAKLKQPFFQWLPKFSPMPLNGRTLFYEEIEWAYNERRRLDEQRKRVKDTINQS